MRKVNVVRQLGRGGFGNVDLVRDENGKEFAHKKFSVNQIIPDDLVENVRKRFIREVKYQKELDHRNIVPIIEFNLDGESPSYLMPVAAASLYDDIANDRTLGGDWKSAVMDIIAGLEELHGMGIYHRDLKPQNVLRFRSAEFGGRDFYAISDFGFISVKESRLSELTRPGMAKGSDFYSAPEIIQDLRRASAASDVYSLGCIMHDMLSGRHRLPCNEIRDAGPYGGVLASCTRGEPRRRFRTVRALADALLSVGDEEAEGAASLDADALLEALRRPIPLDAEVVRRLIDFLEQNYPNDDTKKILRKINSDRIQEVCSKFPDDAGILATIYARWVDSANFDFAECDPIANRVKIFFDCCAVEVKVECALALLELGTSHNRWYVERMFLDLCAGDASEAFVRRMAIEFRVGEEDICRKIAHLEGSIGQSRESMHPILTGALKEICA